MLRSYCFEIRRLTLGLGAIEKSETRLRILSRYQFRANVMWLAWYHKTSFSDAYLATLAVYDTRRQLTRVRSCPILCHPYSLYTTLRSLVTTMTATLLTRPITSSFKIISSTRKARLQDIKLSATTSRSVRATDTNGIMIHILSHRSLSSMFSLRFAVTTSLPAHKQLELFKISLTLIRRTHHPTTSAGRPHRAQRAHASSDEETACAR